MENNPSTNTFFGKSSVVMTVTLGLILILGFGIRLYDLTDPPLDFHSTRQFWSALIARGMYYEKLDLAPEWQRDLAVSTWQGQPAIEPTIFETIVAATYGLVGDEIIWIPRIYAALFWVIGGLGLFFLARNMTSVDGGVIAVIFYLFLPFGAIASRSFQPDPLMVSALIWGWWGFFRWTKVRNWQTALVAGLLIGIALLIKSVAVFMLLIGVAAFIIVEFGFKTALKNRQIWIIAGLSGLPVILYTLYGLYFLEMESQFQGRFFPELLIDPMHYFRWGSEMTSIVGFSGLFLGLVGIFTFEKTSHRAFVIGLWGGYLLFGLFFPYHFLTHNYYHLPLIPLVALSLAPLAAVVFKYIQTRKLHIFSQFAIFAILSAAVGLQMWDIRVELARSDYRHEPPYWEAIADTVGRDHQVVALTQDYGYRLLYYGWLEVHNWPDTGFMKYRDLRGGREMTFDEWFAKHTTDMDYFLVTRIKELDRQQELRETLYTNYPLIKDGEGYLLFDLGSPLQ
jgi:4-amino-4-deoxy-L-arabinose transferase-like glycosyltransferase